MIVFVKNKSTRFCQITLRIKGFIHSRKVVPFFCVTVYIILAACGWPGRRTSWLTRTPLIGQQVRRHAGRGRNSSTPAEPSTTTPTPPYLSGLMTTHRTSSHYYAPYGGGHKLIPRSVCLSVRLSHGAAALGYRHAGCLQRSHARTADP